jgi:hypothetical protein
VVSAFPCRPKGCQMHLKSGTTVSFTQVRLHVDDIWLEDEVYRLADQEPDRVHLVT